jgi:hypothetical protein
MLRAIFGALSACVLMAAAVGARADDWSYRAYEEDGVRWHVLALEDNGYRVAFFCHGAGDGIKITLRTPDPLFMPTAFAVADREQMTAGLRIANREVLAGPYDVTLTVDLNSSYELEFYHVSFYGVIGRNDASYSISDLLTHLQTARQVSLNRVGNDELGHDVALATFDLAATGGAFGRLYALCGDPEPPAEAAEESEVE